MHDVVAHSVSMMVVQAGGARRILDRDPERAVAAAELIERTGREALAEMRTLLGVLHAGEHAELRAAADAAGARRAGRAHPRGRACPSRSQSTASGASCPPGSTSPPTACVQEALTNVVKHGGGAPTEVHVHYRADAVEVRISDQGDGARRRPRWPAAATASSGCASACACTAAS